MLVDEVGLHLPPAQEAEMIRVRVDCDSAFVSWDNERTWLKVTESGAVTTQFRFPDRTQALDATCHECPL